MDLYQACWLLDNKINVKNSLGANFLFRYWSESFGGAISISYGYLNKYEFLKKEGYSDEQIFDFLLELIRFKLPELKGIKIVFCEEPDKNKKHQIIIKII